MLNPECFSTPPPLWDPDSIPTVLYGTRTQSAKFKTFPETELRRIEQRAMSLQDAAVLHLLLSSISFTTFSF